MLDKEIKRDIEEYKIELEILGNGGDAESDHGRADDILCNILKLLGHKDVVDLFLKIDKWYA